MNRLIQRNFSATARLLRVEKNIITHAKENAGMPKPGEIVRVHYTGNFSEIFALCRIRLIPRSISKREWPPEVDQNVSS